MTSDHDSSHQEKDVTSSKRKQRKLDRGQIHPKQVADYKALQPLKLRRQSGSNQYGSLTNDSPYAAYAWEFLRRNRFYQAMIDKVKPAFSIDDWGFPSGDDCGSSCGLIEPYKHYSDSYEDSPTEWESLWEVRTRIQDALKYRHPGKGRTVLNLTGEQVAFVFDLAPAFGPGTLGLQRQADIAVAAIEEYLASNPRSRAGTGDPQVRGPVNDTSKMLLRAYLRVADVLTYPPPTKPNDGLTEGKAKRTTLTLKDAALLLSDSDFIDDPKSAKGKPELTPEKREDRTYAYADLAREYIYEWKCLNLLSFADKKKIAVLTE